MTEQPGVDGVADQLRASAGAELLEDVRPVVLDGPDGEEELGGYLGVGYLCCEIDGLEPIPPSMEDVFVGLIEEQERAVVR